MGFFSGAGAFFSGLGFIVVTPRMWPRAMVPVLAALVVFGGLMAGGIYGAMAYTHGVYVVLLAVPVAILSVVLALSLATPLSGWALDGIVRAQRRALGLPELPAASVLAATLSSIRAALFALLVGTPVIVLLTLVGWVAPPAGVVTVPLKLYVGALMVAWNLADYPLAMQGAGVGARLRWVGRHFGSFNGFALASVAFFLLPGLGLLALPFGVAGAARLVGLETAAPPRLTR